MKRGTSKTKSPTTGLVVILAVSFITLLDTAQGFHSRPTTLLTTLPDQDTSRRQISSLFLTPTPKNDSTEEKKATFLFGFSPRSQTSPVSSASEDKQQQRPGWASFFDMNGTNMDKVEPTTTTATTSVPRKTNQKFNTKTTPLAELQDSPSTPALNLESPETIFAIAAVTGVTILAGVASSIGITADDLIQGGQILVSDPQAFLQNLLDGVQGLGPMGPLYFALIYMVAEVLAVPATPLTLSAGYLFGAQQGVLTVLAGATAAACIGFWISRTFLREYVESTLLAPTETLSSTKSNDIQSSSSSNNSNNTLIKLDKAIGKEGFKLLILIRLSPIFPFSITNYLYGASSIDFGPYLLGTLIGFVPSTTAYVYTGMVGQALTLGGGGGSDQPWYVYAGGFGVLSLLLKLVTDVANGIIEAIDDDDDE